LGVQQVYGKEKLPEEAQRSEKARFTSRIAQKGDKKIINKF
jgi:hypothetical protein